MKSDGRCETKEGEREACGDSDCVSNNREINQSEGRKNKK